MSKETVSQNQTTEEVKVDEQNIDNTTQNQFEYIDEKQLKRERRKELTAKYMPVAKRVVLGIGIGLGIGVVVNVVNSLINGSDDEDEVTVIDGDFTTDNE